MSDARSFHALIRGERRGCVAGAARGLLSAASLPFRGAVALRAAAYSLGLLRARRAALPVVSVGNLTAGGTGKTPLVIALARRLRDRGERVAVLARGYGAERDGELNDELRLIAAAVPEVEIVAGRDRVAGAAAARARGATVALLDDGFQHRRLARDLDFVLVDATEPWGFPPRVLLPRGLLREPPAALRRASAVFLSRAELVGPSELRRLEEEVRATGYAGPLLRTRTRPTRVELLAGPAGAPSPGEEPELLAGQAVLAACGIGNPSAFAATLAQLGARISQLVALPDHHAYTAADVDGLERLARERAVGRVVVTAKDAVKLRPLLAQPSEVTWLALEVEVDVEPEETLNELLARLREEERGVA